MIMKKTSDSQTKRRAEAKTVRKEAAAQKRKIKNDWEEAKIEKYNERGYKHITLSFEKKPSKIRSNSPEVVRKNTNAILSDFEGRNRRKQFVKEIDNLKYDSRVSTKQAIRTWFDGGAVEPMYYGRAKYLSNLGMKQYDPEKAPPNKIYEASDRYEAMMISAGEKIYNEEKSGKSVKKTPARRK